MPDNEITKKNPGAGLFSSRTKKGLSITWKSLVGISIPTLITAFITMVPGIYQDVRDQRKAQQAGYETLSPAVQDLQEESEEILDWADEVAEQAAQQQLMINRLKKKNWKLEQRVYQIEMALQARRIRVRPVVFDDADDLDLTSLIDDDTIPLPAPKSKPKRHIPNSLNAAKTYQEQRVQLKCPAGDPMCGME